MVCELKFHATLDRELKEKKESNDLSKLSVADKALVEDQKFRNIVDLYARVTSRYQTLY